MEPEQLSDVAAELAATGSVVGFETVRDVISVVGPEAVSYLQGQVSQDVEQLSVGAAAWSFVLQPQGKVDGWFRVTRREEEVLVLDLDPGFGSSVVARLERFKLRTKAEISLGKSPMLAVRGPGSTAPDGVVPLPLPRPDQAGFDLIGDDSAQVGRLPRGPAHVLDALRIRAGVPRMGAELTEKTIPAEAGVVAESVSFTKGCYVGQELVARVDSRGSNTPRNLYGVVAPAGFELADAELLAEGEAVGAVTSSASSAELGSIGLAYVRRGVAVPGIAEIRNAAGERAEARIEALPF